MPDHRARRIAVCLTALAACSSTHKPEADPVRLDPIFKAIDRNTPTPGAAPICSPKEMIGGATMTQLTLLRISNVPPNPGPEREDWINPPELDSPAARELIDPSTDDTTRRQAAYELLSAPFYLVYRVDVVDAPMALGVKDLKRGTVSLRALRFDRQGNIVCAKVVAFQNTLEKNDWAITKSNLAVMDPKISAALRDDLRDQLLKHVAALGRPD
ncbi:MAG: hypothetical protein E6J91_01345 [Deltaproteobacteria bacterium]|nr:MAG: hypothetical protein E6J91_01345 [Deltaproteobacteria bacterium]